MGKKSIGGFWVFLLGFLRKRTYLGGAKREIASFQLQIPAGHEPTEPEAETDSRRRVGPWNTIQMAQDGVGLLLLVAVSAIIFLYR